jgi:hypothetical protein
VHRLLELHRERLEEWLEGQQRLLVNIERCTAAEDARHGRRDAQV